MAPRNFTLQSKPTPDRPMRQTRARSKLNNAPPLMQGLDRRGLAQDPLSADPESLAYNDVVQKLGSSPKSALKKANDKLRRKKKVTFRSQPSYSATPPWSPGPSVLLPQSAYHMIALSVLMSQDSSESDDSGDDADDSSNAPPGQSSGNHPSDAEDSDLSDAPSSPDSPSSPGSGSSAPPSPSQSPEDEDDHDSSDDSSSSSDSSESSSSSEDDDSSSSSSSSDSPGPSHAISQGGANDYDARGEGNQDSDSSDSDTSDDGIPPFKPNLHGTSFTPINPPSISSSSQSTPRPETPDHTQDGTPVQASPSSQIDAVAPGTPVATSSGLTSPTEDGAPLDDTSFFSNSPAPEAIDPVDPPVAPDASAVAPVALMEDDQANDTSAPASPAPASSPFGQEGDGDGDKEDEEEEDSLDTPHSCSDGSGKRSRQSGDDDEDEDDAPPTKRQVEASTTTNTSVTATQATGSQDSPDSTPSSPNTDGDSPNNALAEEATGIGSSGSSSSLILPSLDPEIPGLYGSGLRVRPHYDWYEQYHHAGLDCAKVHGCAHNPGRVCHGCHASWQKAWSLFFKAHELLDEAVANPQKYLAETGFDVRQDFMGHLMQGSGWEVLAPELQPPAGKSIRLHPTRIAKHRLALAQMAIV